jgi:hypothetical protein
MNEPIGANVKIKWIDETFHPEHEVETYWVHFSFSEEPDFSESTGEEVDQHGVHDWDIFYYVANEKELEDLMNDDPYDGYVILDYKLVYNIEEMLINKRNS